MISLINLLKETEDIKTAIEIAEYMTGITPDPDAAPDYFISKILASNKIFKLQKVSIKDLLKKDHDLRAYVKSGEDRYGDDSGSDYVPDPEQLYQPIVIFNDEVVDGYSRTAKHVQLGEPTINAYVSV
jgi:hypothetical protein